MTPTEQETAIYDALNAGDQDAIEQMRDDAYEAGAEAVEVFETDHAHAHAHYQADHEPDEAEREAATQTQAQQENVEAG